MFQKFAYKLFNDNNSQIVQRQNGGLNKKNPLPRLVPFPKEWAGGGIKSKPTLCTFLDWSASCQQKAPLLKIVYTSITRPLSPLFSFLFGYEAGVRNTLDIIVENPTSFQIRGSN